MTNTVRKLVVGPTNHHVELCLTDGALQSLGMAAGADGAELTDYREILTTITVAKVASGELHDDTLVVHRHDIEEAFA